MEIKVGDVCTCALKEFGVVTEIKKDIRGNIKLYKGYYLHNPEKRWQSKNPTLIGNLDLFLVRIVRNRLKELNQKNEFGNLELFISDILSGYCRYCGQNLPCFCMCDN